MGNLKEHFLARRNAGNMSSRAAAAAAAAAAALAPGLIGKRRRSRSL